MFFARGGVFPTSFLSPFQLKISFKSNEEHHINMIADGQQWK